MMRRVSTRSTRTIAPVQLVTSAADVRRVSLFQLHLLPTQTDVLANLPIMEQYVSM